jgi:acyl dehydratase
VTLDQFRTMVGEPLGISPWLEVTQAMIDSFAEATGDDQYIHIDPIRARDTSFGGTVAQGFLSLSLMPRLLDMADIYRPAGIAMSVNYGGNRVRFLTAVPANTRVRGRFTLLAFEERGPAQFRMTIDYVLELENSEKPALVAEWITQLSV